VVESTEFSKNTARVFIFVFREAKTGMEGVSDFADTPIWVS
jgi:hypothetical protein